MDVRSVIAERDWIVGPPSYDIYRRFGRCVPR
jgi:hypothetical protein